MPRSADRQRKRDSRLPRWTWGVIAAGGVLSYVGVGSLLLGNRFYEIEGLWRDPAAFVRSGTETVVPYVLLLIPAVLGAIAAREALRVIFRGRLRGDPPATIVKDVALYLLGIVFLILVALYTSPVPRRH